MNAKSWGRLASIALIALNLSACSNTGGNADTSMIGGTENGETSDKRVTLRYSSYLLDTAQAGKVYYDAIKQFEEQNPTIKIEADFIQNNNYTAGIKIRLLGGEQMDVFDTWSPSLFEEFRALRGDMYLDLTDSEFLADFFPNSLKPVTIDGKVYGAPEVMHSDGLLYNKTLFDKLGLEVPQTWDEFLLVCEKLKQAGVIPIAMDSEWSTAQFFWGSIMSNNGADEEWTRKLEEGEVRIADPIFVEAIKMHKDIIDRGFVPPDWQNLKHEQSKDLIGQGEAAMIITGTWDIPSIQERNPGNDIRFMMVPGREKTVPNINVGTYRVISSKTKYPEEAKKFVAFMTGRATQEKLAAGASAVPSVVSAHIDNPVAAEIANAVTREDAALYWPHTVSTETLQTQIQEAVNRYLAGQSLEAALKEIQLVIDEAAEKRRLANE
ncbi:ABC transporter substrate-binding protein [Cohnella thailandensis]|uniref:Sugar ABC transporter substrate-binding protein n=1 Tax=Cohnella thailandensis TaxID=557557 RepID=A0A841SR50_9BACL|nr:sugar ABC transporter substrate-binding protein [Cohnella thailandensis]MBB6633379.1 sugar ABC transporter substrate-binding protein [Cohnella thailandensis]MBP1977278.1 raffinose/stachyose/melibiose transport system substrate-binding protein [Cohnella thailandensis]